MRFGDSKCTEWRQKQLKVEIKLKEIEINMIKD